MNFVFDETRFKAVIFDFDGTLYDFRRLSLWLVAHAPWRTAKIGAERRTRRRLKGSDFGSKEGFEQAFYGELAGEMNVPSAKAKKWYETFYMPHMVRVLEHHYKAREGVQKLLESLRAKSVKLAVFSDYPVVPERLSAIGLDSSSFDEVFSAADIGGFKPSARLFRHVAESMGVEPSQCLVVGDRDDTDGEGARSSGMRFVQIRNHRMLKADAGSFDHPLLLWEEFLESFKF